LLSLRAGLQAALFRLGKVPKLLQIDNSSAATHQISGEGKRDFNPEFLSLVAHYGLTPRTIHVGCPNENGDVEAHNGHLKRRLEQHLLLRGYRDFASEAAYDQFLAEALAKANGPRSTKVAEELALMRELPPTRLCEYDEVECRITKFTKVGDKPGAPITGLWLRGDKRYFQTKYPVTLTKPHPLKRIHRNEDHTAVWNATGPRD
jgi:hypothetical protein